MGLHRFRSDRSLVWCWPYWNQPLQEARDYHAVTGAPTVGLGPFGAYLTFDGAADYITLGASWETPLRFDSGTQDFSIVAWVRRSGAGGALQYVIDKEDANNDGWYLRVTSDLLHFAINGVGAYGPAAITGTDWHCVIGTVDRSAALTVYLDGQPGSPLVLAGPVMATTAVPRIGVVAYANTFHWSGDIAGVGVFNRTLSPAEALDLSS